MLNKIRNKKLCDDFLEYIAASIELEKIPAIGQSN